MRLREFFAEDAIDLQLQSTAKDDVLKELVGLLKLDDKSEQTLVKMLKRRSNQYLPVLGKIAQFAKEPDVPGKLSVVASPKEFLKLLEDKNI